MARLRRSCVGSKSKGKCKHYNIKLISCELYRSKDDCELLKCHKVNHRKGAAQNGNDLYRQ